MLVRFRSRHIPPPLLIVGQVYVFLYRSITNSFLNPIGNVGGNGPMPVQFLLILWDCASVNETQHGLILVRPWLIMHDPPTHSHAGRRRPVNSVALVGSVTENFGNRCRWTHIGGLTNHPSAASWTTPPRSESGPPIGGSHRPGSSPVPIPRSNPQNIVDVIDFGCTIKTTILHDRQNIAIKSQFGPSIQERPSQITPILPVGLIIRC